jgi:hypothetical protein
MGNNERHDCKIGTVWKGYLWEGGRVNRRDEGEGIWLMGFIYVYKTEQ